MKANQEDIPEEGEPTEPAEDQGFLKKKKTKLLQKQKEEEKRK